MKSLAGLCPQFKEVSKSLKFLKWQEYLLFTVGLDVNEVTYSEPLYRLYQGDDSE